MFLRIATTFLFAWVGTSTACGTTSSDVTPAKDKPVVAAANPSSPTSKQIAELCGTLYDSEAGAECRLGARAKDVPKVAVIEVMAVKGDFSHLLMAHSDGTWHAVLELPSNQDQQGAHVDSYKVDHQVSVKQLKGSPPLVMVLSSQEATFKGTDSKAYSSYSNHTTWCGWVSTGPKCCGGVTTEVKVDAVAPKATLVAWKMAVSMTGGQVTVTAVDGAPKPASVLGTHPMCGFPVTAKNAFEDLYGGITVER